MNAEETEAIRRAADWLAERRERESARLLRAAQDLAERLARDQRVRKVILFGSVAQGEVGSGSDFDLAVVADVDPAIPPPDRLRDLYGHLVAARGVDLLVYTPEEFSVFGRTNRFVREEIITKGRILYDRP